MEILKNIESIRKDFPILNTKVNGNQLIYFDNAATSQTPQVVIDSIASYYSSYNSNIHRGVHSLSQEATNEYEESRIKFQKHLNTDNSYEIIFTSGTTHAINLVANGFKKILNKGDEIIISQLEHHSNIVPWQLLTQEKRAKLEYIGMDDNGELNLDDLDKYLATGKVKLVTFSLMSNVLGTITDAKKIIEKCKAAGVLTLIDGAQAVPHMKVDLDTLGCDFFAFSGHKMLAPTGVGILWVRKSVLQTMNPFHGGGDMIREVHKYETTWNDLPYKFEAGTPNIADVIGFGAAIDYLTKIGMDNVRQHEIELTKYAMEKFAKIPGLQIYGTKDIAKRGGVISFNFADVHPHDVADIIDKEGISLRSGHHCAQVLMERLNVAATSRASFYIYNTKEDVDALIDSLNIVAKVFKL